MKIIQGSWSFAYPEDISMTIQITLHEQYQVVFFQLEKISFAHLLNGLIKVEGTMKQRNIFF